MSEERRGDKHLGAEGGQEGTQHYNNHTNTHTLSLSSCHCYREWRHSSWKSTNKRKGVFVIMTHIVYTMTLPLFASSLFVLCDRIGADSLSPVFSWTSPHCLYLNLCLAVCVWLGCYTTIRYPALYKDKTTGLSWAGLCRSNGLQFFHSCMSTVSQLHSRGLVRKSLLHLLLLLLCFVSPLLFLLMWLFSADRNGIAAPPALR